jgi:hypothetical protein
MNEQKPVRITNTNVQPWNTNPGESWTTCYHEYNNIVKENEDNVSWDTSTDYYIKEETRLRQRIEDLERQLRILEGEE